MRLGKETWWDINGNGKKQENGDGGVEWRHEVVGLFRTTYLDGRMVAQFSVR